MATQSPRAADNLDNLLTELCGAISTGNTSDQSNFVKVKDHFILENYPDLETGMHAHPDLFVSKGGSLHFPEEGGKETEEETEAKIFDFLQREFAKDNCFIFQKFDRSGIDIKVVGQFFNRLKDKLIKKESSVYEVEEQL